MSMDSRIIKIINNQAETLNQQAKDSQDKALIIRRQQGLPSYADFLIQEFSQSVTER